MDSAHLYYSMLLGSNYSAWQGRWAGTNLKSSSAAASELFQDRAGSAGTLAETSRKLCSLRARSGARPPCTEQVSLGHSNVCNLQLHAQMAILVPGEKQIQTHFRDYKQAHHGGRTLYAVCADSPDCASSCMPAQKPVEIPVSSRLPAATAHRNKIR